MYKNIARKNTVRLSALFIMMIFSAVAGAAAAAAVAAGAGAGTDADSPRINGPRVFGVRPGSPFFYTIPATGARPLTFAAGNLPVGLQIDPATGIITGKIINNNNNNNNTTTTGVGASNTGASKYKVTLRATNALGSATRELEIITGGKIALTPPLGWNSWNCWGDTITQEKILAAARALKSTGLADHGWSYINIDDGWQGARDPVTGAIMPNKKFPDMRTLCDAIHALGLRAGIYSTPWTKSFAGGAGGTSGAPENENNVRDLKKGWFVGASHHEHADARQWAAWGFDYLKYDWGPMDLASGRRMRAALDACGRDIIFNVTNSAPKSDARAWAELAETYFLWRRPEQGDGDIKDSWESVSSIGFRMSEWRDHAGPGHWNDPDMLVLGHVGWGAEQHPCRLTRDEQRAHFSLWVLLAAPLLLGCDLARLDDFTLSLLTNDEVIEIHQDPAGHMAERALARDGVEIWVKQLETGARAIGIFNRNDTPREYTFVLNDAGLVTPCRLRDLWLRENIGPGAYHFNIPAHGAILFHADPI
jgi:alpha-galactosidase